MRVSPHTAQASLKSARIGATRLRNSITASSLKQIILSRRLCNTHPQPTDAFVRGRTSGSLSIHRHLHFPVCWFYRFSCKERPDRRGLIPRITRGRWLLRSSPSRLGSAGLAVLPATRHARPDPRGFHVLHPPQDGLGPLCTPAVQQSRRATLENPNLTAYHFGPSLDQPRMACS
jgi:hypothetical protein